MGEKTDSEKLASIVDYAKGLRTWGSDELSQLATDILFMAGEKVAA
jgi:hypothetical protein